MGVEEWREERKRSLARIRKILKKYAIVIIKDKTIYESKEIKEPQMCIGKGI